MKIALEVRDNAKMIKPSKDNIILYDGKVWYVTTKEELFGEYERMINNKLEKLSKLIDTLAKDNAEFKESVSKDVLEISTIVKDMYEKGE